MAMTSPRGVDIALNSGSCKKSTLIDAHVSSLGAHSMSSYTSPRPKPLPTPALATPASPEPTRAVCIGFLRQIELFSDMSDDTLSIVLAEMVPRAYEKDMVIINDGDDAYEFIIVTKGKIKVRHPMVTRDVVELEPGDVFGEKSLLSRRTLLRTAETITSVELLTLTQKAFLRHVTSQRSKRACPGHHTPPLTTVMSTRALKAFKEECEEFLAQETDNAYLSRLLIEVRAQLKMSMQDDMKEHGGVLEYWWENQRSRKINPLPFAASPELSPRRNKQCLQYFDSCDTKNRRR